MLWMWKIQKIEPHRNSLWWPNVSEVVCKRDWQREDLFIYNMRKFWTLHQVPLLWTERFLWLSFFFFKQMENRETHSDPSLGCSLLFLLFLLGKISHLKMYLASCSIGHIITCFQIFSLCIVNDELFVRNATTEEIRRAFVAPAPTPSSSPVPTLSAPQQEMLAAFSLMSGMNLEWSQK